MAYTTLNAVAGELIAKQIARDLLGISPTKWYRAIHFQCDLLGQFFFVFVLSRNMAEREHFYRK